MTKSESLVHDTYGMHQESWQDPFRKHVVRQLARAARQWFTSIYPLHLDPRISELSNPVTRSASVSEEAASSAIVDELVDAQSSFRKDLATTFQDSGVDRPKGGKLRSILILLVNKSINSPTGSAIIAGASEHEIYSELANLLSEELHRLATTASHPLEERLTLNYSILVYYFRRWRMPYFDLPGAINELNTGHLGIRGKLISIQTRHRPSANTDDFALPIVPFSPGTLSEGIQGHSDILRAVQAESNAIASDSGFMRRLMPVSTPLDPSVMAQSPNATQDLAEEGRKIIYLQFEQTALIFMSLAGIEFLLRSFSPGTSQHRSSLQNVIDLHSSIPTPLRDRLNHICSTKHWNIRNRCMHGSFLEIEGRRGDLIRSSGVLLDRGVILSDLSEDGSLPENVSGVVLEALCEMAQYIESVSTTCDTSWAQHFMLDSSELEEARVVHCEFLQDLETAEGWRVQIRDYLREVTPCLSTPLQLGIQGWFTNVNLPDSISPFHFLALLYEPFLRLTLHLANKPVLQQSSTADSNGSFFQVQYSMLDSRGLLTSENVAWLVAHLKEEEKATAARVLELAMKCRDAFAHGAVFRFTEEIRGIYGHMLVKAIQLVVEVGLNHLDSLDPNVDPNSEL